MEKITTIEAQKQLIDLVKSVTEENKTYQINDNHGAVVLMSQQAYESLQETLELLSIPRIRESLQTSLQQIKNNETYSLDEVFGDID